ncbi:hypothetical protein FE844_002960 [Rhizobium indicum]|uniref:hypothetical protein n=1 Tax=Rhizobium indicum TaxID=2583231 RepID=UPI00127637CB|nr:hypothetical protein [Rhizobium indicum]QKK28597.1 hypothetical protein FE844_002960 [Rhizobium indicum]
MMVKLIGAVALACCVTSAVGAFDFQCADFRPMLQDRQLERPQKPNCSTTYYAFNDSYEFDKCRREIEAFKSEVQKYLACLESESKETVAEYNDVVSSFNRKAQQ